MKAEEVRSERWTRSRTFDEKKQAFRLRTRNFAGQIVRLFCQLPRGRFEVEVIGKQIIRSGTSVAANYREASRARTPAEFIAKIGTCIQEADETQLWLELLKQDCHLSLPELDTLWKETEELLSIFITMSKNTQKSST